MHYCVQRDTNDTIMAGDNNSNFNMKNNFTNFLLFFPPLHMNQMHEI